VSTDSGVLRSAYGVRSLSDNRVMVHDLIRKRVVLFDGSLKTFTAVLDTAQGTGALYGAFNSGLVPYLGDSTLLVDRASTALLLIDPLGKVVRAMSPPKSDDMYSMSDALFDSKGFVYYRGSRPPPPVKAPAVRAPPPARGVPQITSSLVDSAPIVRADFETRSVDTVAMMHIPVAKMAWLNIPTSNGNYTRVGIQVLDPLPLTDEWTLLPDGTVAIVRGQDYHIDWIAPDGKVTSTPKMPFDWKRITAEDKTQIIDSLRAAYDARPDSLKMNVRLDNGKKFVMPFFSVEPADLPDFYPAVRSGQVKADPEGNLWVLPATSATAAGGLLFDVVNRNGEVFERVQLPPNRNLVALGPGGIVYLSSPVGPAGVVLERAQVIRPGTGTIKP
jgi:hypothetical protein